jgi:hypothetical protein
MIKQTLNNLEERFPNGKITKICAWVLSLTFIGIVLLERVPGVMTPTSDPYESLMFNLFKISFLDDVTHGLSGLMGLFSIWKGKDMIVKWMMLIGGYYCLDAGFHTVYALLVGEEFMHWFPINAPHYGITILCIIGLYFGVKNIQVK